MKTELTQSLVLKLSSEYDATELSSLEKKIFNQLSPQIAEQGFVSKDQFLEICSWKTTRTHSLVRENSGEDIIEISSQAFSCSHHLRIKYLTLLKGVAVPTASAILAVWSPSEFTVYDFRVLSAIGKLEHELLAASPLEVSKMGYLTYLKLACEISEQIKVSLRDLDKCLWMFDKYYNK